MRFSRSESFLKVGLLTVVFGCLACAVGPVYEAPQIEGKRVVLAPVSSSMLADGADASYATGIVRSVLTQCKISLVEPFEVESVLAENGIDRESVDSATLAAGLGQILGAEFALFGVLGRSIAHPTLRDPVEFRLVLVETETKAVVWEEEISPTLGSPPLALGGDRSFRLDNVVRSVAREFCLEFGSF